MVESTFWLTKVQLARISAFSIVVGSLVYVGHLTQVEVAILVPLGLLIFILLYFIPIAITVIITNAVVLTDYFPRYTCRNIFYISQSVALAFCLILSDSLDDSWLAAAIGSLTLSISFYLLFLVIAFPLQFIKNALDRDKIRTKMMKHKYQNIRR